MSDQIYITSEGLEKLKVELGELKNTKRKEIIERIEKAKELGDLSENAEYSQARDEQAFVEGRIAELDHILKNANVVSNNGNSNKVQIGSHITAENDSGQKKFHIVGVNEVSPLEGKISNESPLGSAFIGKKVGDKVEIKTPKGMSKYKIINIS